MTNKKQKQKQKQIKITFLDNAELALSQFKAKKGDISDDYCRDTLYTSIFDKLKTDENDIKMMPDATSLNNLFVMLGATPRKKSEVIQKNFMWEDKDGKIGTLEW